MCVSEFADLSGYQVSLVILQLHIINILFKQKKKKKVKTKKKINITVVDIKKETPAAWKSEA